MAEVPGQRRAGQGTVRIGAGRDSREPAGGAEEITRLGSAAAQLVLLERQVPARDTDFVARSDEFAAAGQPAVRLIVGEADDRDGFIEPARRLREALAGRYTDASRADLVVVPRMAHALADEPGVEPAPQIESAVAADQFAVEWLGHHLAGSRGRGADAGRISMT